MIGCTVEVKLDFFFVLFKDFQHSLSECQYEGALLGLGVTSRAKID